MPRELMIREKMCVWWLFTVCLAALFQSSLSAQELMDRRFDTPDVTVEWQFGLGGRIYGSDQHGARLRYTSHISLRVTNHRDSLLEAVVDVGLVGQHIEEMPEAVRQIMRKPIDVGPGSTKRFSFPVLENERFWGWNSPSFAVQPGAGAEIRVSDAGTGRVLWKRAAEFPVEEMSNASMLRSLIIGPAARVPMLRVTPQYGNKPVSTGERAVEFIGIEPWQAPDMFTCLAPVNAVILSPETAIDELTLAQRRALAEYVANSGLLVLPAGQSEDWEEKVFGNARIPFTLKDTGHGGVWRYGNGKVAVVAMPAPGQRDATSERLIYDLIDAHPEPPLAKKLDFIRYGDELGPNAWKSSAAVAGFLGLYALVCGPFLYFFRKLRRAALIRAVALMVAVFSFGSVGVGVVVRAIPGDVDWNTFTEACLGGGAIQHGRFHFISAGNRNQGFNVTPPETLLLPNSTERNWGYGGDPGRTAEPETLPLDGSEHYGDANIAIVPWGHAYWKSRTYLGDVQPLTVTVGVPDRVDYEVEITVSNPNPFYISRGRLFLETHALNPNGGGLEPCTLTAELGSVPPRRSITVTSILRKNQNPRYSLPMQIAPPVRPLLDRVDAYVTGVLPSSPGLAIKPGTGFESNSESHVFFQRLESGGLPTLEDLQRVPWYRYMPQSRRR